MIGVVVALVICQCLSRRWGGMYVRVSVHAWGSVSVSVLHVVVGVESGCLLVTVFVSVGAVYAVQVVQCDGGV